LPLAYGFNGFLVQAHAQRAGDAHVARTAVGAHHQPQHADALVLGLAGFFGVLRIRLVQNAWRAHAAHSGLVDTAAGAAAFARPNPGANAGAHAAARSGADAATRPNAIGGR